MRKIQLRNTGFKENARGKLRLENGGMHMDKNREGPHDSRRVEHVVFENQF